MHHYTASGLDNVWLSNGYNESKTPYGRAVAIEAADELHAVLALEVVKKKGRLTGKEFRFLRVQMGVSQAALAKIHGVSEQAVSLWERRGHVPKVNDMISRLCYMSHIDGNTTLAKAIERVMKVEQLVHQKIVLRKGTRKWSSTVTDAQPDLLVA